MDSPSSSLTGCPRFNDLKINKLPYSLDEECPVSWPVGMDEEFCQEYPFLHDESGSNTDYVAKLYLETLWLPESIKPLQHFVQSLRLIESSTSQLKQLHDSLKGLFRSVRSLQIKYHQRVSRILDQEEESPDIEHNMMWFAWNKGIYPNDGDSNDASLEQSWKREWITKLEQREVMLQILLYFYVLSLPKRAPSTPPPKSSKKRKAPLGPPTPAKPIFPPASSIEAAVATPSPAIVASDKSMALEDRLEFFMDKLSLWQLVSSLGDPTSSQPQPTNRTQRDWMQVFCEDVVEPLFRDRLPELCDLLRTKVFPHNIFSDDPGDEPLPVRAPKKSKAKERRAPSPLRLTEVQKKANPAQSRTQASSSMSGVNAAPRQRERSRSVSVMVDDMKVHGANRGGIANNKSLFQSDFVMNKKKVTSKGSNLFQPTATSSGSTATRGFTRQPSQVNIFKPSSSKLPLPPASMGAKALVKDTPVKKTIKREVEQDSPDPILLRGKLLWSPVSSREDDIDDEELLSQPHIFVADTPIKKRSI